MTVSFWMSARLNLLADDSRGGRIKKLFAAPGTNIRGNAGDLYAVGKAKRYLPALYSARSTICADPH
jgi:hypothetical protein